jgi:hypothetical protein
MNTSTGADRRALFDADKFNLPALVNIGLSYDMRLDQNESTYFHRLTASGNFQYNAFQSNILGFGAVSNAKTLSGNLAHCSPVGSGNFLALFFIFVFVIIVQLLSFYLLEI